MSTYLSTKSVFAQVLMCGAIFFGRTLVREGMALAQYIAGMGFSNVGLGIAHSIAHTLGAHYDTPHGVACAMMLPIVMEYNQEYTGERRS